MSLKRQSPWPAIEIKQAWQIIEETIDLYLEQLRLIEQKETNKKLLGYVLAETLLAFKPVPNFRASIMDGYAVICSDGKGSRKVIGVSNAGILNEHKLINGQCIRISTGAKIPEGADAVVKLEDTEVLEEDIDGKEILIDIGIEPKLGQFIREIGSDVAKDELLLRKGTKLDPPEIGLILVFKCPQICVISSGDELVDFNTFENNEWPNNGVMDTNRPLIISIIQEEGFEAIDCGIAIDSRESLTEVLNNAFTKANIIVISGGVSMGEKDLIKSILTENFNLKIHFGRVYMKPGLPTTFASGIGKDGHPKLVFALPGNPVSAFVSAHLFVIPQLRRISGLERNWENQRITVELINSIPLLDSRPEYKRAILLHSNKGNIIPTIPKAECLIGNQISSRLLSTRSANLLLELPTKEEEEEEKKINNKEGLKIGDYVQALIIGKI